MPDVPEKAPDLPDAPLGEGTDALAGKEETEGDGGRDGGCGGVTEGKREVE